MMINPLLHFVEKRKNLLGWKGVSGRILNAPLTIVQRKLASAKFCAYVKRTFDLKMKVKIGGSDRP